MYNSTHGFDEDHGQLDDGRELLDTFIFKSSVGTTLALSFSTDDLEGMPLFTWEQPSRFQSTGDDDSLDDVMDGAAEHLDIKEGGHVQIRYSLTYTPPYSL
jgi:hypothetical protein